MARKSLDYNATLIQRIDATAELGTFRVRYDVPLPGDPPFIPGQYVAIGLEESERGPVLRSMSLASAPEQREAVEFYIRFVREPESDNALTHILWQMREGDRLYATRKPVGRFTIPDTLGADDPRLRVLVAAGTGLAPFVSMVRSMHLRDPSMDMSGTVLLHGASYPADLGYREELLGYREQRGLRYFATVSRPAEAPDWSGDTGRVEDYFLPERIEELEARIGLESGELTPERAGVLICGLQGTIARTIERLACRGFVPYRRKIRRRLEVPEEVPASLWWEQYDTDPVVDLDDPDAVRRLAEDLDAGLADL